MTPCPVASRIMADQDIALQEAYHHREDKALLLRYAGAVASALDRHLAACVFCKETTMTQHTPGPWEASEAKAPANRIIVGPNPHFPGKRMTLADVFGFTGAESAEANARIIAAAPDLLEALRSILPLAVHTSPEDVAVHA